MNTFLVMCSVHIFFFYWYAKIIEAKFIIIPKHPLSCVCVGYLNGIFKTFSITLQYEEWKKKLLIGDIYFFAVKINLGLQNETCSSYRLEYILYFKCNYQREKKRTFIYLPGKSRRISHCVWNDFFLLCIQYRWLKKKSTPVSIRHLKKQIKEQTKRRFV